MRLNAKGKRRMLRKIPRQAHCTGCGVTFDAHHLLVQHRNLERCGGRFLPEEERAIWNAKQPKKAPKPTLEDKTYAFIVQRTLIEMRRTVKKVKNARRVRIRAEQCARWRAA